MSLLTAGYWQKEYNPNSYWHEDYWGDALGAATPPRCGARKHWMFGSVIRLLIFASLFIVLCIGA